MIAKIILLALMTLGLGIDIAKHGEPRKGTYNAWSSIISYLIVIVILYYSGFFKY